MISYRDVVVLDEGTNLADAARVVSILQGYGEAAFRFEEPVGVEFSVEYEDVWTLREMLFNIQQELSAMHAIMYEPDPQWMEHVANGREKDLLGAILFALESVAHLRTGFPLSTNSIPTVNDGGLHLEFANGEVFVVTASQIRGATR